MNFEHKVRHTLPATVQWNSSSAFCLVMPQQYLTHADLVVTSAGTNSVEKLDEADGMGKSNSAVPSPTTTVPPSSDLKIALFEKVGIKKALYCNLKRRFKEDICLLEVKFANDVFTVTMVLLQDGSKLDQQSCSAEQGLLESLKESLSQSLTGNIKFRLANEKWSMTVESHENRVKSFVQKASEEFMIKELDIEQIFQTKIAENEDEARKESKDSQALNEDTQNRLSQQSFNSMLKYSIVRHFESTEKWVACNIGSGLFLIQKSLLKRPEAPKNQQNLLKLEMRLSNAELMAEFGEKPLLMLSYRLHLTIRLSKVLYVDYRNFNKIGEQQFYVLPDFQKACLADMYQNQARKMAQSDISEMQPLSPPQMTHVKVKYIRSDIEQIVNPARLVWCPTPYEMPCQSLFYALLKYRQVVDELNWVSFTSPDDDPKAFCYEIESFKFVHLQNIHRRMNNNGGGNGASAESIDFGKKIKSPQSSTLFQSPSVTSVFDKLKQHATSGGDDFGFKPASDVQTTSKATDKVANPEIHDEYEDFEIIKQQRKEKEDQEKELLEQQRRSRKSTQEPIDFQQEDCGIWGDIEKPFVGFKMASMTLRKIKKYDPTSLEDNKDASDDANNTEMKDGASLKWTKEQDGDLKQEQAVSQDEEEIKAQKEAEEVAKKNADALSELEELLQFVDKYSDAADFFDQNGTRQIYSKFRDENSRERILHNIIHFFISLHLPQVEKLQRNETPIDLAHKKSNLKKSIHGVDYLRRMAEVSKSSSVRNTRQQTNHNGDDRPRTNEERKQLFDWWDKEMQIDREEQSLDQPVPNDQAMLKMAKENQPALLKQPQVGFQKTCRGQLKQRTKFQVPVKNAEYTFFTKKVRLNVVEKQVHKFELDEDEVNLKKAKKKTSSRKNY